MLLSHHSFNSLHSTRCACIRRHICVVRCTRTLSCHLHRQTPLLRPSLAMTSSSPSVDSWAPCTVFQQLLPHCWGSSAMEASSIFMGPQRACMTQHEWRREWKYSFVETMTLLNEDSFSDILWRKVNVCANYVHFVSYCHMQSWSCKGLGFEHVSLGLLVVVLPTLVLVLVLKQQVWPWPWSCHCWSWVLTTRLITAGIVRL